MRSENGPFTRALFFFANKSFPLMEVIDMLRDHKKVKNIYKLRSAGYLTFGVVSILGGTFWIIDAIAGYKEDAKWLDLSGHTSWDDWKRFEKLGNFLDKITAEKES